MIRRQFLKTSLASATTFMLTPSFSLKAAKPDAMNRIALTTVVFRNQFSTTYPNKDELEMN
jgi:hypothetical protein